MQFLVKNDSGKCNNLIRQALFSLLSRFLLMIYNQLNNLGQVEMEKFENIEMNESHMGVFIN